MFGREFSVGDGLRWRGEARPDPEPGSVCSATIEIGDEPLRSRHVQRHHPRRRVERALRDAGLDALEVRGQGQGGRLPGEPDERAPRQHVYPVRKGGVRMVVAP